MSEGSDTTGGAERGSGPAWLETPALHAVAVVLGAALALFGGGVGRWLGAALLIGFAPVLMLPWVRRARWWHRTAPWLPHASFAVLAIVLLGELALGRPPGTRDHGIHYFQTHILIHDLLPLGQLSGWSSRLNHGYPFGDSYPVLGYLLAGLPNLLSGGLIPLRTAYAWFLLALWIGSALGVWWVASLLTREILPSEDEGRASWAPAWAGCIAASLWLLDPGSARQGGWNYLMFHGVWPQQLSTALWILGIPLTWRALEAPTPRRIALAALALGGAVLGHPFGLLTVAATAAAWPVLIEVTGARERLAPGPLKTWLLIHLGAGLSCLGWLLGFLASARYMGRSPVPWEPLPQLAADLFAGELFDATRAWAGVLAIIGAVVAVRRGKTLGWLVALVGLGLLVLASEAAITVLRLDLLVSSFKNLQFPRYSIAIKPLWFALAGVGAGRLLVLLRHASPRTPGDEGPSPRAPDLRRVFLALALAPLAVALFDGPGYLVRRPVGGLHTLESSRHATAERALRATLRREAEQLGDRPLTVAFFRTGMSGGTYPLYAITDASDDARVVLDGHIPSVNYRYRVRGRDAQTLAQLGVTHVLHDRPLTGPDAALLDHLQPVGQPGELGDYTLLRFSAPHPPKVRGELVAGAGPGFDLPAPVDGGRVTAPVPPYRNWVVRADGEVLEHESGRLTSALVGLAVAVPPGATHIEYRYESPRLERGARWVSLAGLAMLLVGLAFGRSIEWTERLESDTAQRVSRVMVLLILGLLLAFGLRRQSRQLARTWQQLADGKEPGASGLRFARDLVVEGDLRPVLPTDDRCDGMMGKDAMADCATPDEASRISMAYKSPYLYRCLWINVPPRATTSVPLQLEPGEVAIQGFVERLGGKGSSRQLLVQTSPDSHGQTLRHVRSFRLREDALADGFALQIENRDDQSQQVCVAAAAYTPAP